MQHNRFVRILEDKDVLGHLTVLSTDGFHVNKPRFKNSFSSHIDCLLTLHLYTRR